MKLCSCFAIIVVCSVGYAGERTEKQIENAKEILVNILYKQGDRQDWLKNNPQAKETLESVPALHIYVYEGGFMGAGFLDDKIVYCTITRPVILEASKKHAKELVDKIGDPDDVALTPIEEKSGAVLKQLFFIRKANVSIERLVFKTDDKFIGPHVETFTVVDLKRLEAVKNRLDK